MYSDVYICSRFFFVYVYIFFNTFLGTVLIFFITFLGAVLFFLWLALLSGKIWFLPDKQCFFNRFAAGNDIWRFTLFTPCFYPILSVWKAFFWAIKLHVIYIYHASFAKKKLKTFFSTDCVLLFLKKIKKNTFSKLFSVFFRVLLFPKLNCLRIFTQFLSTITKYNFLLFL